MKISLTVLKLYSGQAFICKVSKGYTSANVVRLLVPCTSSDSGLYLCHVSCKIFDGIKVIERTRFSC